VLKDVFEICDLYCCPNQVGILFAEKLNATHPRYGYVDVYVKGIYEGSPADRSPITEGDALIEINGENVKGLGLAQIAPRIVGKLNSPVQLGFKRAKPEASAGALKLFAFCMSIAKQKCSDHFQMHFLNSELVQTTARSTPSTWSAPRSTPRDPSTLSSCARTPPRPSRLRPPRGRIRARRTRTPS
jgi:hypothetical protein